MKQLKGWVDVVFTQSCSICGGFTHLPSRSSDQHMAGGKSLNAIKKLWKPSQVCTHGSWRGPKLKKKHPSFLLMPNCHKLREDSKNVSLKIGSYGPQKLGPFSHFSSWEKRLSSGQKWFLRPYFPLIGGIFLLKSGLRFSFRALEVPEPRVKKRPY